MKRAILLLLLLPGCLESPDPDRAPVIVGSKSAAESVVLSEIAAQRLEARGCTVVRRFRLGDTRQLNAAIEAKQIDAYAEEFSAAYTKVLGRDIDGQDAAAEPEVRSVYVKRDLLWAPPMGFRDSAMVYRKPIDDKCRRASRAMMSLGFATTEAEVRALAIEVARGGDVAALVRAAAAKRDSGK